MRLDGDFGDLSSCAAGCRHTSACRAQYMHAARSSSARGRISNRSCRLRPGQHPHALESCTGDTSMGTRATRADGQWGSTRLCRCLEHDQARARRLQLCTASPLAMSAAASSCQHRHRVELPVDCSFEPVHSRSDSFQSLRWVTVWPKGAPRNRVRREQGRCGGSTPAPAFVGTLDF